MKKFIMVCMMCMLMLCGCSDTDSEPEKTVCKMTLQNIIETTNTLEYKGERVTKQIIEEKFKISDTGMSEDTWLNTLKGEEAKYELKGTSLEYGVTEDGYLTTKITIDYTNADFEELAKAGFVESSNGAIITYVDYESTLQTLKTAGYTCE